MPRPANTSPEAAASIRENSRRHGIFSARCELLHTCSHRHRVRSPRRATRCAGRRWSGGMRELREFVSVRYAPEGRASCRQYGSHLVAGGPPAGYRHRSTPGCSDPEAAAPRGPSRIPNRCLTQLCVVCQDRGDSIHAAVRKLEAKASGVIDRLPPLPPRSNTPGPAPTGRPIRGYLPTSHVTCVGAVALTRGLRRDPAFGRPEATGSKGRSSC